MIQLDKRWNITLGSWICLGNLVLWSLQAIVQIIRNGALSAPVIQSAGFAFFGIRSIHGQGQADTGVWSGPRCFPCRLSPG